MPEFDRVTSLLSGSQRFVLTTHVNPDGDGLGSEVALAEWLRYRGKDVAILNHDPVPPNYRFLDPEKRIRQYDPAHDGEFLRSADVTIVLDTNHPARLESMERDFLESNAVKVCIDHHLDPAPFALHYIIDASATSTGELVYRLLAAAGASVLSPSIAQALYCAIMTDTGSFRYSNIDAEIHRIVAHLIECGADPGNIYREIYEQWSPGRIRLLGEALAGMNIDYQGLLAHISVDREMLDRTGTTESDTDNFTIYPMSVSGVVAGIMFVELSDGVKMSLRSRGPIPINELAKEFGGNGHRNAAGARARGTPLAVFRQQVVHAAEKYLFQKGTPETS